MAAADYRLMTEATGQRIAIALENLAGFGAYLTTSDVVDNLTSTATDKPGSANMLKTLNDNFANYAYAIKQDYSARNASQLIDAAINDARTNMNTIGLNFLVLSGIVQDTAPYTCYFGRFNANILHGIVAFGTDIYIVQYNNGTITKYKATTTSV